jgi:hypothetical protein
MLDQCAMPMLMRESDLHKELVRGFEDEVKRIIHLVDLGGDEVFPTVLAPRAGGVYQP